MEAARVTEKTLKSYEQAAKTEIHLVEKVTEQKKSKQGYWIIKRVFDVVMSCLALVVLSPVFLVTAIFIKVEDGGNIIYRRRCVGPNHTEYIMYKFRSMRVDADNLENVFTDEQLNQYKKECKLDNDPRITKVGKFIRKYSIDELPQLVTVMKGDMSLVGPRPMVQFETEFYGNELNKVLQATPGMTGYWQVNGRSDATYESGERQKLELYYAENQSLGLDIQIILQTFKVVLGGKGAK